MDVESDTPSVRWHYMGLHNAGRSQARPSVPSVTAAGVSPDTKLDRAQTNVGQIRMCFKKAQCAFTTLKAKNSR